MDPKTEIALRALAESLRHQKKYFVFTGPDFFKAVEASSEKDIILWDECYGFKSK